MSRKEDIENGIWSDPDFMVLSEHAALLYLWSFTNPRCGMAGLYKVGEQAMPESRVPARSIPGALEELAKADFAYYEHQVLWVRTRVKHLNGRGPRVADSVARDVAKIAPTHPLRRRFLAYYGTVPWLQNALKEEYAKTFGSTHAASDCLTVPRRSPDRPGAGAGVNNVKVKGIRYEQPDVDVDVDVGQRQTKGSGETGKGKAAAKGQLLPDDFPEELKPHLRIAYRVLCSWAKRHGARGVKPMALALVVMARRNKPLVRAVYDCVAYWEGGGRQVKDVVGAYRNWLDRCEDLAGVELLNGTPQPGSLAAERQRRLEAFESLAKEKGVQL